jgi:hypothetical protein
MMLMIKRLLAVVLLAVVVAVTITAVAGRDVPGGSDDDAEGPLEDDNGCALGVYANTDFRLDRDDGGDLTICHFEMQPQGDDASHLLDWSRPLSREQSASVRAVIRAAPRGKQEFTGCDVAPENGPGEFFLIFTEGYGSVPFWVYNAACGDNGVLAVNAKGRTVNRLDTAEVLEALGSSYGPLGPPTDQ